MGSPRATKKRGSSTLTHFFNVHINDKPYTISNKYFILLCDIAYNLQNISDREKDDKKPKRGVL